MKRTTIITAAAFFLLTRVPCVPGEVYFYKDKNNTLHFSDNPTHPSYKLFFPPKHKKIRNAYRSGKNAGNNYVVRKHIERTAEKFNLDSKLIEAIIRIESNFDPEAVSPAGAVGLMQLMPETAKEMNVRNPRDPLQNITGGARYFRQMLDKFSGNTKLALAAYNAGPEPVRAYKGIPPFPETQKYVKKVLAAHKKTKYQSKKTKHQRRKIYRIVRKDGSLLLSDSPR